MIGPMKEANGPVAREFRIGQTMPRMSICAGPVACTVDTAATLGVGAACAGVTSTHASTNVSAATADIGRQDLRMDRASTGIPARLGSFIMISDRQPPSEYCSD